MTTLDQHEAKHMRRAIALAMQARERGDNPFGAVLVSAEGRVLAEGANTEQTARDVTGHAETNLLRDACRTLDAETLAGSTLYASGEPCAMCAGTIFWSGVARVIYGASAERIRHLMAKSPAEPHLNLSCRDVLTHGSRPTEVIGPVMEEEAERVLAGGDD